MKKIGKIISNEALEIKKQYLLLAAKDYGLPTLGFDFSNSAIDFEF